MTARLPDRPGEGEGGECGQVGTGEEGTRAASEIAFEPVYESVEIVDRDPFRRRGASTGAGVG
ncbi:hypothetical protein Sme01_69850 [Sphaerisporangium melleum]|uniref:Uncharacterized protein n=1 Tax=Sphaerisporangium melleum TaxID=321316 RepID=A0A917RM71_9ACTN|nr:hypothetical protein GCM10007964_64510 [Sphaerisporangium melleum]GII74509.1 hypothetical protein Sme01_69850 [Sphaerisporangium melleum]